jgi:hypothetical protein
MGLHFLDYVRWTFGEVVAWGRAAHRHPERLTPTAFSTSAPPGRACVAPHRRGEHHDRHLFIAPVNLPSRVTVISSDGVPSCAATTASPAPGEGQRRSFGSNHRADPT